MTFGIDLGTTHSCVACIDETGRSAVIKSALGEDTTPSAVYFESPQSVVIGRAAKDAARLEPEKVAQLVKRDMGTDAEYSYLRERHTPETISALILRELARTAAEHTGEQVRDVVITVPAYFGVAEREATRRAGQIAGLNVLDVLAEPVAAALHYQAVTSGSKPGVRDILVYDLGGGTFDTTVIRLDGDDITVVCTDGDHRLGRRGLGRCPGRLPAGRVRGRASRAGAARRSSVHAGPAHLGRAAQEGPEYDPGPPVHHALRRRSDPGGAHPGQAGGTNRAPARPHHRGDAADDATRPAAWASIITTMCCWSAG